MPNPPDTTPLEEPQARLELAFIEEFLRSLGYDPADVRHRTDATAHQLMAQASTYAAIRLTEVESRARYIHDIHG